MTEKEENPTPKIKITSVIDEDENTRLHYAAASGNIENVTQEINNGHEIDPANYLGWTPLMMATRHGHPAVVEFLLSKRADATKENRFMCSIFLMAVASGNLDVLHLILQHLLNGGISKQSMQSVFSPISLSVLFGNVKIIQYLIEKSFCINSSSSIGIPPLTFARALGNAEIINLLISKGARAKSNQNENKQVNKPPVLNLLPPIVEIHQPCYSPQPCLNFVPVVQMARRCSEMMSPCFSANITPVSGGFVQQVFFPQTFSPNQFASPQPPVFPTNNDFLNVAVMQVSPFYSPVPYNQG